MGWRLKWVHLSEKKFGLVVNLWRCLTICNRLIYTINRLSWRNHYRLDLSMMRSLIIWHVFFRISWSVDCLKRLLFAFFGYCLNPLHATSLDCVHILIIIDLALLLWTRWLVLIDFAKLWYLVSRLKVIFQGQRSPFPTLAIFVVLRSQVAPIMIEIFPCRILVLNFSILKFLAMIFLR